jgi:hypothetical protein
MPQGPTPLNPVPRSLLDQFLQELADLGLSDRQVEGHLVFLRLWQKFLAPQRLLDATPEDLPSFVTFLKEQALKPAEVRLAEEAVEHFYAFTLDRHPTWEERASWSDFFEKPPATREVPMWTAIAKKFLPHLKRVDHGLIAWERP